jgi:hypothetical protein
MKSGSETFDPYLAFHLCASVPHLWLKTAFLCVLGVSAVNRLCFPMVRGLACEAAGKSYTGWSLRPITRIGSEPKEA